MNEINKRVNDKFFQNIDNEPLPEEETDIQRANDKSSQTMNDSINCASCDFMQRVGDNREFVICKKTNRELLSYNYVDEKCPFLDETDIQRANDPKFTLKVIAMMIVVLFTSVFIIGMCMMFM